MPGRDYITEAGVAPGPDRTCLDKRSCAAPGRVYITGSELHLDVSGQQEPLLLSDVSTPQHLDLFTLQWPVLHLDISGLHDSSMFREYTVKCTLILIIDNR
jgi:hypothetical protein